MPDDAPQHVIETLDLTKVFRDFWHRPRVRALDKLTLKVRRGEVFGLLGPNGSGKSTTMKLLLGLLFPTSGYIRVLGRPPRDVRVKDRIGFLPEETYLYPYLDARETLDFFGRLNRIPRAERRRRVNALIDMVGLSSARRRVLKEYSKGMARRIGLAQALINDPELVLLDEPTTGLDPLGTREVKNLILQLKQRGKTILMCSHLLADVQDVCDRIGVLYAGKLWVAGAVDELLAKEQLTQVTLPALSPEAQARVRQVLREATGAEPIEVGHPRDRLDEFFLRVVEEARRAQPQTAGVGAGRFDETLFKEEPKQAEAREVVERLVVQPGEQEPEEAPAAEPEAEPEPSVLDELTGQAEAREEAEAERERDEATREVEQAEETERRAVLDRLVGKDAQDNNESQ
ncbi:MAG: ABC transporter ATP-binding protein [Planctomycetota bacterium]